MRVLSRWARSSMVHVLFAFLAMGGWAVFANSGHPMPQPLISGFLQGALSAGLTLFLKSVIDGLSRRFGGPSRFWAPPLIACLGSASLLVTLHALGRTPEILKTVAVPLLVSTTYGWTYAYSISRKRGEP
ncbi:MULTISPECIES: hypothetical protein [unclassified Sinorhizobium]|uniref:hypothetical protein n=1 Tax=unclassified Sinorhizobium TaxID=2613772 RepID=UPI0024C3976E|nr:MULTISPECIES: hypothetical protein [unclassified Sinorhizobium]MDK1373592.1 hypothetical protein [Sinorhizobium sp. 6-70]MDK1480203.1 hypothetical protein [Sinorhizobium sp. 6-117]